MPSRSPFAIHIERHNLIVEHKALVSPRLMRSRVAGATGARYLVTMRAGDALASGDVGQVALSRLKV
jgi:hypothetical protein